MVIKIVCTTDIGKALMSTLTAMQAVAGRDFDEETLQVEISLEEDKPRQLGPRTRYRAVLPTGPSVTAADKMAAIEETLRGLGEHTMKGIIYGDIAKATLEDRVITERQITESRHYRSKTVQRSIVELRHGGLVASEPLMIKTQE